MIGYFATELSLEAVPPDRWRLADHFIYIHRPQTGDQTVTIVPSGFETDLASIPRVARPLITGHGLDRWAATLHDYLYHIGHPRREADQLFRAAYLAAVEQYAHHLSRRQRRWAWLKAWVLWAAVRLGGWAAYSTK